MSDSLSHIERLESESIHFRGESVAEARRPLMLFAGRKDSTVMAHLALRAFYPGSPFLPLMHNGYDLNFGGAPRPVVDRDRSLVVVDDPNRMRFRTGEEKELKARSVRFRTLGCWPVTGAITSEASNLQAFVAETPCASASERRGRVSARDSGSLEEQKRQGYF